MKREQRDRGARARAKREPCAETWIIEKLVPGGSGFCRAGAVSAFADGTFPGDRIAVDEREVHAGHVRATKFRLLEPGPDRVEPACPVADTCGGCDWMRLSDAAQLRHKAALVREAFARTAGIELDSTFAMIAGDAPLGYRNRVRLHVDAAGKVGFYARGTNAIVSPEACAVAAPSVNDALRRLLELARSEPGKWTSVESVELVGVPGTDEVEVTLSFRPSVIERVKRELSTRVAEATAATVPSHPASAPLRSFPLPFGLTLQARAGGFTQINWGVNLSLVTAVVDGARARSIATFLDLYAGSGNFSLPLAASGLSGVAVEAEAASSALAEIASKAQHIAGLDVMWSPVVPALRALARGKRRFELAILDPPRAGAKDIIEPLSKLEPEWIAYVACDPVTLARDVKALIASGYALDRVTGYDMFPQTHHVEVLAWLSRSKSSKS